MNRSRPANWSLSDGQQKTGCIWKNLSQPPCEQILTPRGLPWKQAWETRGSIKAQARCGRGAHSSKYSWPTSGPRQRGLGTGGVRSCQTAGSHPKLGFPNRTPAVPPTPILRGLLRGWKTKHPRMALPTLLAGRSPPPTNACQPAWIPSPAPETSLTTSPISQASPGGRRPAPRVG